jgi:thymidylate synthase ThyX
MSPNRQIYLLDPKKLSPETIAVTFAKTSRSAQSFSEIAAELSDEKSADFNEKWVVGYGHSSVAEHAVLHIAVENVSRLAIECLESNRLASYTEKSSRYQIWGMESFHTPSEFVGTPVETRFRQTCQRLFSSYEKAVTAVQAHLEKIDPQKENESAGAFKMRIRTRCADVCRYYLPACSLANLGMTINARALEHALCKMLSHPLEEVQRIGADIKRVAQDNVPTLVKYAARNECMQRVSTGFLSLVEGISASDETAQDWLQVLSSEPQGEEHVLAALLYRFGEISYTQALAHVKMLSQVEKAAMAEQFLGRLSEHDIPLRELEYASITVDMLLDQGAYFELKRHRMMTQTPQRFTARLGYATPKLLEDAGLLDSYRADMQEVITVYEELAVLNPEAAAYILPNAFNRRVLLCMNLRSALHFVKLRSAPNAHFAIRRTAQRLADELQIRYPLFADYFRPASQETWESITGEYFTDYR